MTLSFVGLSSLLCLLAVSTMMMASAAPFAEFVANCPFSHMSRDDPIVFFDQPGASHSHQFYGANVTKHDTTLADLLAGGTTCNVVGDKSGYWHPTLYNNGVAVEANDVNEVKFYYLNHHNDPTKVIPYPPGFKMIAGDASLSEPAPGPRRAWWSCLNADISQLDIPTCPGDSQLELFIDFPDCWDGVNLDSLTHKSHVTYSENGECPDTHPNRFPTLQFKIRFPFAGGPLASISSGSDYSLHGDFFNGWEEDELEYRVRNCVWQAKKCKFDGLPEDGSGEYPNQNKAFEPIVRGVGATEYDPYDACPDDPNKMTPGECGCGEEDVDANSDGVAECADGGAAVTPSSAMIDALFFM